MASYIFYRRFPNNFQSPNFFAEEGMLFTKNLQDKGFIASLLTTFNGYFIWGIYALLEVGRAINALLFHGAFINLPRAYALTSYLFWGFCAALPILLLRRYLRWYYLVLLAALICCVPAGGWDYGLFGIIGNFKFIFVYIAFLLILYRNKLPKTSRRVYFVDALLLLCGYTNVTVYALLPATLIPYIADIRRHWRRPLELLRFPGIHSLVGLVILLLPQLIVVKIFGIPKLTGYLDTPLSKDRIIETYVHRPLLYAVAFGFNKHFNDLLALAGAALVLISAILLRTKQNILPVALGLYAIFASTALILFNRPGIGAFFSGYHDGGPTQFFYTQNLIFYVILVVLLAALVKRISRPIASVALVCAGVFVIAYQLPYAGSLGANDYMQKNIGTIYANANQLCASKPQHPLNLTEYPAKEVVYQNIDPRLLCTDELAHHQAIEIDLGLAPSTSYLELANQPHFTQTFTATQPNLEGVDILLSNFGARIRSDYHLTLFAADCSTKIDSSTLERWLIKDNEYLPIRFKPIAASQNNRYCFTIEATENNPKTPIAIHYSNSDYTGGDLMVNSQLQTSDIVFRPLYNERPNQ